MIETRFFLVRHAATDALGIRLSGRSDVALNAAGVLQAARLARSFAGTPVTAILSSPQRRTQQTAGALAAELGRPVQAEAALDEIDFGPWTGETFASLVTRPAWLLWNTHRSLAPAPGSETMLQAQARAAALLPRLHAEQPGGTFVLVSHADILKAILAGLLGMPVDLMQRLEIAPASRSLVVMGSGRTRVEHMNLRPGDRA